MYGHPYGAGPFMMGQPQQQPQYVFVPVSTPSAGMPMPPPLPPRKPSKGMSYKKMLKIKANIERAMEEAEKSKPKKEEKPKRLKDKTFNWIEMWALLITWALPVSLLVLGGVKMFTILVKSFIM